MSESNSPTNCETAMHLNGPGYPSWKKDPQGKWYTAVTAAVCLGVLCAIVIVAAVCAAVNLAGVR